MERIFYKTKKIISFLMVILVIGVIIAPISEAAVTSSMKVGDKYKYTGSLLIVYRNKDGAKSSSIFKIRKTLKKGSEITIEEIDGDIIKIGSSQYIKCTVLNIKKFTKISSGVEISEKTPEPEATQEPEKKPEIEVTQEPEKNLEPEVIAVTNINLNKTKAEIYVTETLKLTAAVKPTNATNTEVTWKSSDTSVATVDLNGKVTAKKVGTAKITATAKDGSGKSAQCTITVKQFVTKVTLNKTESALNIEKTLKLTATITPEDATNKAVTWKSSNTNVATVDLNGKVTAKKAGTAKITATAKDGSGKSAQCTITVKQPVSSITLSSSKSSIYIGDTLNLTATIAPTNATNTAVTWKSSNTDVATVNSSGKVTAKKVGTAKITATAKDGSGKSAQCTVTVNDLYSYTFNNNTYKIAVKNEKLDSVLATIADKKIAQKYGGSGYCNRIATYHIFMLLGKIDLNKAFHGSSSGGSYSSSFQNKTVKSSMNGNVSNLKYCIDNKKPARLHVNSGTGGHWVTVVGYKGEGKIFSDYLILSCYYGYLIQGTTSDAQYILSDSSGIRTYN